ncbi:MAG TPA: hypothetical protein PL110_03675 [Candidatus Eremiobacteraeota bacterium]|nr:hypothetical protein [Candidatus Eremiobacteraeota bacterium]
MNRKEKILYDWAGKIKVEKSDTGLTLYKHQEEVIQDLNEKIVNHPPINWWVIHFVLFALLLL